MIDIVTMLFDFILDDDNLQSEVKAVISRLQIPILKVGLIDKTFFSNRKHSARLLLNELAHTGVSWDPEDKSSEPMLVKIRAIVETVCSDFSDDVAIFRVLLDDFLDFKQEFSKRAQIFEKRTKEAEEGKAKAEGARAKVNRELKKICHNKHVPEVVQQLFRNAWVHVMFLESLRADEDAWARVCQLARMLVWSVQPVHEQERLNKLIKNVPLLIKNLNLGFTKISFSHIEASGLLDRLEDTHREIIQKARVAIKENDKEVIIRLKPVDPMAGNVENHEGSNNIEESGVEAFNKVEIESIAFTEEQIGMLNKSAKGNIKIEEESRNKVENLHAGSWFELKIKEGFKRCKLAARILSSGKFIFVNRSGVKVAEYLTDELAIEYQLRNLKVLNDEALFDRALESVISNLRTMKSTS